MQPKEGTEIGDYVRSRLHKAPEPIASPTSTVDPMEQLRKLGELRDAGVLTPEGFEQKKRELLERI